MRKLIAKVGPVGRRALPLIALLVAAFLAARGSDSHQWPQPW